MRTFMIGAALFAAAHMSAIVAPKAEVIHYTATLTGAAETPPTNSKGTGALTATYDTGTKIRVDGRLFRPHRPGDCSPFPRASPGREAGPGRSASPSPARQPDEGRGDIDRHPGQGPDGRHDVFQHPHRRAQAGRDPRPNGKGDVRRARCEVRGAAFGRTGSGEAHDEAVRAPRDRLGADRPRPSRRLRARCGGSCSKTPPRY